MYTNPSTIARVVEPDLTSGEVITQAGEGRRRPKGRGRVTLLAALLAVLCTAATSLWALPASARVNPNLPYDGTDPYATGCAATKKVVATKNVAGGTLYLMWSTKCKTNWAQFSSGGAGWVSDGVVRGSTFCGNQQGNGCGSQWYWDSTYSNQLYGCNYSIYAAVLIWNNGNPYWAYTNPVGGC